jgi:spore coat protein U-like protein
MNPYHIAIIFNNLKGLRYLTIRLNQHLRLCLNAPDINYGGLQVRDQNIINRECWSLFVAINNINLSMLMFLW